MNILEAIDRFINRRVMNPVFTLVQKMFHCNRFDLMILTIYVSVGSAFVGYTFCTVFLLGLNPQIEMGLLGLGVPLCLVVAWRMMIRHAIDELSEASQKYESGKRFTPSETMRVFMGLLVVMRILFPLLIPTSFLLDSIRETKDLPLVTDVAISLIYIAVYILMHLWQIDDIDPEDRDHIFEDDRVRDQG